MGAFELGKAPLEFGVGAYTNSVCGNGVVEGGESCDGSNLDGASCQSLGFSGGSLSCSSCSFNTNGCTGDDTAPSVPQGLDATTAGQTQIDLSWSASNDPETGVSSYNIFRDGSSVGQTGSTSFSDTGLSSGTSYTYRVSAVNGAGLESAQSGAVTQSTGSPAPDTTPPTIGSVLATSNTTVEVVFDEPVGAGSAGNASNYSINNGTAVSAANLGSDLVTVTLSTSAMGAGSYTLTVNNVADLSSNTIASNSTASFTYSSNTTLERRVGTSADDAEQIGSALQSASSDLELVDEASTQIVGIRYRSVTIPQGAVITNAYVQFQVDEVTSGATSLVIRGDDRDDAPALASELLDARPLTSASSRGVRPPGTAWVRQARISGRPTSPP